MTPYVELQSDIIRALRKIQEKDPTFLKALASRYCVEHPFSIFIDDLTKIRSYGLQVTDYELQDWAQPFISEILKQQIDISGKEIVIRNLLGTEFTPRWPIDYSEYIKCRGSGNSLLRTHYFAHPQVLKKGDILATGERLLGYPREGGNGSVLLHLTGGLDGHWISVPSRIPIALLVKEHGAPPELVEK